MQVVMDLPERFVTDRSPEDLAQQIRLYGALLMYRAGELSAGAACELAGIDRYTFLDECKRLGIETLETSVDEIKADLELLSRVSDAGRR